MRRRLLSIHHIQAVRKNPCLSESPKSTPMHYFLICGIRELRVRHIKGPDQDLMESGAETGPDRNLDPAKAFMSITVMPHVW